MPPRSSTQAGAESITHGELRAAAAEARFLEGFLRMVERLAEESGLDGEDEALARFTGRMARKVGALASMKWRWQTTSMLPQGDRR